MEEQIDDVRINQVTEVIAPNQLMQEAPLDPNIIQSVFDSRERISKILHKKDDRLLIIIGPCSIHDPEAAMDYADKLQQVSNQYEGELEIVMRVYFEKPRTTIGWKGYINDPDLDGSNNIDKGLRLARQLLVDVSKLGLPAATEFLDPITPQYIGDLISWGAIGARTTESQIHRQLASGLSAPIGFKKWHRWINTNRNRCDQIRYESSYVFVRNKGWKIGNRIDNRKQRLSCYPSRRK